MPLTHWIPECNIYKFHTKPNMMTSLEGTNGIDGELECRLWTWIPFWLRLEIPRNRQIMSSFFVEIFADLSLVYHRWDFEFSRNLRRVMKIHCLQFKFNFGKSLFEVNYKTRRHGKYQRLQKSSFKHVISHVQFVLARSKWSQSR